MKRLSLTAALWGCIGTGSCTVGTASVPPPPPPSRWILGEGMTTVRPVTTDANLPHGDFIEQGGLRCGQVVEYHVDGKRRLSLKRGVVWPCLRIIPNDTTGSLIRHYGSEAEPAVSVDGAPLGPVVVDRVLLDGTLTILGRAGTDLAVTRCTFPSPERRCAIDRWTLRNTGTKSRTVTVAPLALRQDVPGPYGTNHSEVICTAPVSTTLAPGGELSFAVLFRAWLDGEQAEAVDAAADEAARRAHVAALQRASSKATGQSGHLQFSSVARVQRAHGRQRYMRTLAL